MLSIVHTHKNSIPPTCNQPEDEADGPPLLVVGIEEEEAGIEVDEFLLMRWGEFSCEFIPHECHNWTIASFQFLKFLGGL